MAQFAQYYIKYHHDFAPFEWEARQDHLRLLFEKDDSIQFSVGPEDNKKVFNHCVYHLQVEPHVIVMRFANSIDIPIEKNFQPDVARDEPSCFVIIDNRDNLRSVAIQKRKKAFSSPSQVAKILTDQISDMLYERWCYTLEVLPVYYPEDLFKAWETLQKDVQSMRFGVPEYTDDEVLRKVEELKKEGKAYFDDSLMPALLELALEAKKAKYKQFYTVMPEDKKTALYVDKTSRYMKNLLTMSRALDMPVDLVTNDGASYRCFVERDYDNTDKIVCREFNADSLEQLFSKRDKLNHLLDDADINRIEGEVIEFLNGMKHESEDDEEQKVA